MSEQRHREPKPNSIRAAAAELGVTPNTIRAWIKRKRVETNESRSRSGTIILRKIYDEQGHEIWHAHRKSAEQVAERRRRAQWERRARIMAECDKWGLCSAVQNLMKHGYTEYEAIKVIMRCSKIK